MLIFQTKNLRKDFKGTKAVNNISLEIKQNCIYGLLGPNGAGKSTTLKMLTGLLKPTSGEIFFKGHKFTRKDLNEIGSLIENPPIYGNLTARENCDVYRYLTNTSLERANEVLELVGLSQFKHKKASQFSMGMKQRLGIAIALLHNPELLILDEPTNGLDPVGIKELREFISQLPSRGITVILSSHNLSEVQQIAQYLGIINNGKLLYQEKVNPHENIEEIFMRVIEEKQ